ncbi:hypothetical protein Taro_037119 [Colocasia esculenta]|uniref:Uncharacterized protein n=1 Tax=Colocasia esculenta TaxID=4460 RepID=A0A843WFC1_COLES|nr:hypothetical protein [Colocasia esculenta]
MLSLRMRQSGGMEVVNKARHRPCPALVAFQNQEKSMATICIHFLPSYHMTAAIMEGFPSQPKLHQEGGVESRTCGDSQLVHAHGPFPFLKGDSPKEIKVDGRAQLC